jgi:ubiquinone/menaquinone biosynthesis C-methylase UbiE
MGPIRTLALATLLAAAGCTGSVPSTDPMAVGREPGGADGLFSPDDLGVLEGPDRDEWQQPDRVMDALQIADGARVADVGAGGGWFTVRLAHRVGPNGVVYAEDIQQEMIDAIRRRAQYEELTNVEEILGTTTDPMLPDDLQAVLIVDAYPQFGQPVEMLRSVAEALAPNGRLGIVDFTKEGAGGPGPPIDERLDPERIIRDATTAGLRLERRETLRYQYLLVFVKAS